jgi:signal transduction histidine kinase
VSIKIRIIIAVVLLITFLRSMVFYDNIVQDNKRIETRLELYSNDTTDFLKRYEEDIFKIYSNRLTTLLHFSFVKEAFKNKDISKMKQIIAQRYKFIKNEYKAVNVLHLIDKNNISIFRAHRPNQFGDDLTKVRPMVVKSNASKKILSGYEVGKYGLSYRINVPVVYKGIHYGLLEIGFDMKQVIQDIEKTFKKGYGFIYIDKNKVQNFMDKDKLEIIDNNYIVYRNDFFSSIKDFFIKTQIKKDDKTYRAISYDFKHHNNETVAKVKYFYDITEDEKLHDMIIHRMILQTLITIVLIIIILYYSFTYYEKRLLKLVEENKQKDSMILQQNKLAIMGEMMAMIAHQWRQPLAAISTSAQGIAFKKNLGVLTDTYMNEQIDSIKSLSLHMSQTITDFSNFFKPEKDKQDINLKEVIQKSIKIVSTTIKNNSIGVSVDCPEDINFMVYKGEFQQVLINIITNAKDALIENRLNDRKIDIKASLDNKYMSLFISDNAGGIPEDIISKIFEPYFSTKSKNGTGLGLYMSKIIIEEHLNGRLEVKNVGNGASFLIKIPIDEEKN